MKSYFSHSNFRAEALSVRPPQLVWTKGWPVNVTVDDVLAVLSKALEESHIEQYVVLPIDINKPKPRNLNDRCDFAVAYVEFTTSEWLSKALHKEWTTFQGRTIHFKSTSDNQKQLRTTLAAKAANRYLQQPPTAGAPVVETLPPPPYQEGAEQHKEEPRLAHGTPLPVLHSSGEDDEEEEEEEHSCCKLCKLFGTKPRIPRLSKAGWNQ